MILALFYTHIIWIQKKFIKLITVEKYVEEIGFETFVWPRTTFANRFAARRLGR